MTLLPHEAAASDDEAARLADALETGGAAAIAAWHRREHPRLMRVAAALTRGRMQAAEVSNWRRKFERIQRDVDGAGAGVTASE